MCCSSAKAERPSLTLEGLPSSPVLQKAKQRQPRIDAASLLRGLGSSDWPCIFRPAVNCCFYAPREAVKELLARRSGSMGGGPSGFQQLFNSRPVLTNLLPQSGKLFLNYNRCNCALAKRLVSPEKTPISQSQNLRSADCEEAGLEDTNGSTASILVQH
jgi:hypothetical protein